jgi:hypothetical protein
LFSHGPKGPAVFKKKHFSAEVIENRRKDLKNNSATLGVFGGRFFVAASVKITRSVFRADF